MNELRIQQLYLENNCATSAASMLSEFEDYFPVGNSFNLEPRSNLTLNSS